jgi:CheY-like chemotaxis protein
MLRTNRSLPRILVADDDLTIRQLVCTLVKRDGYLVDCVPDGEEAIAKLQENEYAVILLDLMMPRVDGFGVIDYLKAHPPARKPLILVITAYADQRFKEVDPGVVSGILRKPFEIAELGNIIALCVESFEENGADRAATRDLSRETGKHAH